MIGNFFGNGLGGQAEKTRTLYEILNEEFGYIKKIDVFEKKPHQIFRQIWLGFCECDQIIVILSSPGYFKIQPFLVLLKRLTNTKVYEFVIGGIRQEYLQGKKNRIQREHCIEMIYVETAHMVDEYKKLGLKNVVCIPNFKRIYNKADVKNQDINLIEKRIQMEGLRLCTFSRIDREKGIDTAIEITTLIKKKTDIKVSLSIIGPIEKGYEESFWRLIKDSDSERIKYVGAVPSAAAVETLKDYDVLLFPTHWKTEGFPGTFIDAMAAGLLVFATDRMNFRDIVKDGYNGWLIDEWSVDTYVHKIMQLVQKPELLLKMKHNAVMEAGKYDAVLVLRTVMEDLRR